MIYAPLGLVFGGLVTMTSRVQIERQRGRAEVACGLPEGPIIVISNHTSYADGVLPVLALRSGAPIVPVAMVGAHEVVARRRVVLSMIANVVRRPRVQVKIGSPMDVVVLSGGITNPSQEVVREMTDSMMAELIALVAELRGEEPQHPAGVPREA